ncbi:MAG: histidine phosphatase family protein [Alphaproteobacteria bacterium]|nr:histidine phosphatase family protein [Alphaproteobacteria bacterium]
MPKLYLVRHGKAAGSFGEDADPGLSQEGRGEADAVAEELKARGPLAVVTSPLRRCRETAAPLAALWRREARVLEAVREVPSPVPFAERGEWLRGFLQTSWDKAPAELLAWREGVVAALKALTEDTVVFTHFVPINVAVGAAKDTRRIVNFSPDNCSVTILHADAHALAVLDLGREAKTVIR